MRFDKDACAEHLRAHAERRLGVHERATHVRRAMVAGGLGATGNPLYVKDYGPFLVRLGFAEINNAAYTPQIGGIAVMLGNRVSTVGHVAGRDGRHLISDLVRAGMLPEPAYRATGTDEVYRPYGDARGRRCGRSRRPGRPRSSTSSSLGCGDRRRDAVRQPAQRRF